MHSIGPSSATLPRTFPRSPNLFPRSPNLFRREIKFLRRSVRARVGAVGLVSARVDLTCLAPRGHKPTSRPRVLHPSDAARSGPCTARLRGCRTRDCLVTPVHSRARLVQDAEHAPAHRMSDKARARRECSQLGSFRFDRDPAHSTRREHAPFVEGRRPDQSVKDLLLLDVLLNRPGSGRDSSWTFC
jgi:hypothetical protein